MSSHIRTGVDDGVALIEIARPDKKNALTGDRVVVHSATSRLRSPTITVPASIQPRRNASSRSHGKMM